MPQVTIWPGPVSEPGGFISCGYLPGTLVGPTRLFHSGPPEDPRPAKEEIAYLVRFAQHVFPAVHLSARDVSGAFAGVRPVLGSAVEGPSAASREERPGCHPPKWGRRCGC